MTGWTAGPAPGESVWLRIEEASSAAGARRQAAAIAAPLGFSAQRLAEIQLAATEAATNLQRHAVQGEMVLSTVRTGDSVALDLVCMDTGPGMADVSRSLRDGHTTGGTLGVGLGTISRLADAFDLHSLPDRGTVMTARFALEPQPEGGYATGGLIRPLLGEEVSGDRFAFCVSEGVGYAMLCDGLGHGPLAARASEEAVRAFRDLPGRPSPEAILRRLHAALAGTRGGALAVAAIDAGRGSVAFAGLGNVAGWIVRPDGRQGMISAPGIAGHQARTFREHRYTLPAGATVLLHSDGLTDRWKPADYPGLFSRGPLVAAGALMRDAGVRRDDRAILAVKAVDDG
ncbi:ATP-binding protein [Actinomadura craniellae]|uniref:ATP-binding protein n=1 Tax=Actinomadura craniellae TaxID=2231787 RepID=UPI001F250EBC|nr:ATP-binding protein [Actinomadura craniellae]